MKNYFKIAFLTLAVVCAGALTSMANTVSYQLTGTADSNGKAYSLSQFDPTLGTLTGITLTATGYEAGSFTVRNNLGTSDFVNAPKDNFVTLHYISESDSTAYLAINKTLATGDTFPYAIAGFQQLSFTLSAGNAFTTYTDIFSDFAGRKSNYIGTGNVNFSIDNAPQVTTTGGFYTTNTTGIGAVETLHIVYTYDPVPEPSTWACLIIGGMIFLARRRSGLFARQS